jgi:hypothetical protein
MAHTHSLTGAYAHLSLCLWSKISIVSLTHTSIWIVAQLLKELEDLQAPPSLAVHLSPCSTRVIDGIPEPLSILSSRSFAASMSQRSQLHCESDMRVSIPLDVSTRHQGLAS